MYGIGGFGGMGGFGGGYGGNPQFQNAVGQHFGNMMGGGVEHGMGNQMGYAPGGMPQQNPNYGQLGQGHQMLMDTTMPVPPRPNQFMGSLPGSNVYADALRMRADRAREFGFGNSGNMVQPGGMDYLRGQFGGGWNVAPDNDAAYGRPYFGGGFNPSPDGGRVDNPDMQNPFRTFNNGNPFYNAKGNLRMRYRNMQPSYQ